MRVLMAATSSATEGTTAQYVDVYNLHTDAGTEADDIAARNSNLAQVSRHIAYWSGGAPVLVFGDTNSRYTRPADDIEIFGRDNTLRDAWADVLHAGTPLSVENACGNPVQPHDGCETVDKIFYRGSPLSSLTVTDFRYDSINFLQGDGSILSDHNPVLGNFSLGAGERMRMSPLVGGPHGEPFSDVDALAGASAGATKATRISLRGAKRLDAVSITLSTGTTFAHGGSGGDESALDLGAGEVLVSMRLCQNEKNGRTRVFYARATTSAGRTVAAGSESGECSQVNAPAGWQIAGFIGRSGDEVDQLAALFVKR